MHQATYPTLEDFYDGEPGSAGFTRKWSGEVDFGVWWKNRTVPWPRYRVSFVVDTGEVYAFRQAHTDDRPDVIVLGVTEPGNKDRIETILEGWVDWCGRDGGLQWVHAQMVNAGATEALI